jgi:hypothetical protein
MISRRTLVLFGFAILLFAIPYAYYAGELVDCHAHDLARGKSPTNQQNDGVYFDVCSMVDFGMYDWMRYSVLLGIVTFIATAHFYRKDRQSAKRDVGE